MYRKQFCNEGIDERNFNFQTVIVEILPDSFNSKLILKGKQESNQLGTNQFTCLIILLRDIYTRVFKVRAILLRFAWVILAEALLRQNALPLIRSPRRLTNKMSWIN